VTSFRLFGGRVEILLLLAFAVVETAVGFYLWICIVSLFQVKAVGLPDYYFLAFVFIS
jgi:hypothetical protein